DVAGDAAALARAHGAGPRDRSRGVGVTWRIPNPESRIPIAAARPAARTFTRADVARRRARRRLPGALLLAGGRSAERADAERAEPRVPDDGLSAARHAGAADARGTSGHA